MKILDFFLFLWVIFALLDPDPDPATQINADPKPCQKMLLLRKTIEYFSFMLDIFLNFTMCLKTILKAFLLFLAFFHCYEQFNTFLAPVSSVLKVFLK